jgi:hypothetical protein
VKIIKFSFKAEAAWLLLLGLAPLVASLLFLAFRQLWR